MPQLCHQLKALRLNRHLLAGSHRKLPLMLFCLVSADVHQRKRRQSESRDCMRNRTENGQM